MGFRQIDEGRLEVDLDYRFAYVAEFIGFGPEEIWTIRETLPRLLPILPDLIDRVFERLSTYDATWRHLLAARDLTPADPCVPSDFSPPGYDAIRFAKSQMLCYLTALFTRPYDGRMAAYLDLVGRIHRPGADVTDGEIPLVQMNALLGLLADALTAACFGLDLDVACLQQTVRAIQKLFWLQNDLLARHYQADEPLLTA